VHSVVLLSVYNHARIIKLRIIKFTLLTHYVSLVQFMLGLLLDMSSLTTPTYVTKLTSLEIDVEVFLMLGTTVQYEQRTPL
jgi:hypothetical protein